MKVESINSRKRFGDYSPRANESVPEGMRFFAGVALTLWVPILLVCYVIGQALPAYVIFGNGVLGTLLGIRMYKRASSGFLSCVPVSRTANVPRDPHQSEMKKVA
jgi:hypothetical protein